MSRIRIQLEIEADYDGENVEALKVYGPKGEITYGELQNGVFGVYDTISLDDLFALALNEQPECSVSFLSGAMNPGGQLGH